MDIAGFVLAGGRSRRMGRDKALLELNGQPLVLRAVELLRPHVCAVTVIGPRARYSHLGFPVVEDHYSADGPLVGLSTGLRSSNCDWNLFLSCDMPFVSARLLQSIRERVLAGPAPAIVPKIGEQWQPLCAAYHRSCLPVMERAIAEGRLAVVQLLPLLPPDALPVAAEDEGMFHNVNSAEDWEKVQRLAGACGT